MQLIVFILVSLLAILIGSTILSKTHVVIKPYLKIYFAITIGYSILAIASYYLSLLVGYPAGAYLTIITTAVICLFRYYKHRYSINWRSLFSGPIWFYLLMILFATIYIALLLHHVIPTREAGLSTGESTYGDLPFHLSIITAISYGHDFPPHHPMYLGIKLAYPFLADFISSIFLSLGSTIRFAVISPSIILGLSLFALLYDFSLTILGTVKKALLSTWLYLFGGGIGFYYFLKDYNFDLHQIVGILKNPVGMIEYSHLFDKNIQWVNFLSRIIVPERSVLLGIPIGLIILRFLYFRGNHAKKIQYYEAMIAGLLLSQMPLLHTHTVLVFAIVMPLLTLYSLYQGHWDKELIYKYLVTLLTTLIMVIPEIPLFLEHINAPAGFFHWQAWWTKDVMESPVTYWFKNSYILIPLSLMALLPNVGNRNVKALLFVACALFVAVNIAVYSPYSWDNIKFLLWAGIFFVIATTAGLSWIWKKLGPFSLSIVGILVLTMSLTGIISLRRELFVENIIYTNDALELSNFAMEHTSPSAVFLTYRYHNGSINNLAGRHIVMGYSGILWTQGIDASERDQDVRLMYAGLGDYTKLLSYYQVKYVLIEKNWEDNMTINRQEYARYPLVFANDTYQLYQVN